MDGEFADFGGGGPVDDGGVAGRAVGAGRGMHGGWCVECGDLCGYDMVGQGPLRLV